MAIALSLSSTKRPESTDGDEVSGKFFILVQDAGARCTRGYTYVRYEALVLLSTILEGVVTCTGLRVLVM